MDTKERLFVYGTLRPGCGNDGLLTGRTCDTRLATADGLALFASTSGGFPYAVVEPGSRIVGTLHLLTQDQWTASKPRLDGLEGFWPDRPEAESHYLRRRWPVRTADGLEFFAWLYVAGPRVHPAQRIPSGDWLRR